MGKRDLTRGIADTAITAHHESVTAGKGSDVERRYGDVMPPAHCTPDDQGPDCWLTPDQRQALISELGLRINAANESFCDEILAAEVQERIKDASQETPMLLQLATEIAFSVLGVAVSKLGAWLARIPAGVQASARKRVEPVAIEAWARSSGIGEATERITEIDNRFDATAIETVADAMLKGSQSALQGAAQSVRGSQGVADFLASLRDRVRQQGQELRGRARTLTDDQLLAMAFYYDFENHTSEVYREKLDQLLARYAQDVEALDRTTVAVRVQGPATDQHRIAICHRESTRIVFLRWAHDDTAPLAEGRQSGTTGHISIEVGDPRFVAYQDLLGGDYVQAERHPAIVAWLQETRPRYVVNDDGSVDEGGVTWWNE